MSILNPRNLTRRKRRRRGKRQRLRDLHKKRSKSVLPTKLKPRDLLRKLRFRPRKSFGKKLKRSLQKRLN